MGDVPAVNNKMSSASGASRRGAPSLRPKNIVPAKPPYGRPWLIYSIPFLTIYWNPIAKIIIAESEYNINLVDLAILLIMVTILFKKHSPVRGPSLLKRYGAPSPSMLFLLTWLIAVPMIVSTVILFSFSMLISDILIFAKRIGEYALIAIFIPRLVSFQDIKPILSMIMISGGIVSTFAIGEAINLKARAESWLMYANNLGLYAVVVFNVAAALFLSPKLKRRERLLSMLCAALSVVTLVLSGSRAASLGMLASLGFWAIAKWPGRVKSKSAIRLIIVFVIVIVVLLMVGSNFLDRWAEFRAEGIETLQVQARVQASKLGLRIFAHYPFLGTGISGLPEISLAYFDGPRYWTLEGELHNTGNQFLQIAVEGGIVALVVFILWLMMIKNLVNGRFADLQDEQQLIVPKNAVKSNMIALLAAGTGMHTFYVPQIMAILWLLIGILYINKISKRSNIRI